ncbi:hypothetical protein BJ742DRAFT_789585 [Cladochytrium replicatum]|nr:hypothetical protein BJ742DRAFT_789585 [Cladochytrium replicatum]
MAVKIRLVKVQDQPEDSLRHMRALRQEAGWDEEYVNLWLEKSLDGRGNFALAYTGDLEEQNVVEGDYPTKDYPHLVGLIGVTWTEDTPLDPTFARRDEGIIQLTSLVIAKRYLRKGLGLEMMLLGDGLARECGAKKIVSLTRQTNNISINMHQKAGYTITGTRMRSWTTEDLPAVFFEKDV